MNQPPRHDLDAVIDRVAERMVAVPEDTSLLARTMAELPERQATPWFMAFGVQLAAAAAVLLVAFVFARPSQERVRPAVPEVASVAPAIALIPDPRPPIPAATPAVSPSLARRLPTPDSQLRQGSGGQARLPAVMRDDHERSLAPVAAIDALELVGITPLAMELDAAAAPEALVVPELALDTKGDS